MPLSELFRLATGKKKPCSSEIPSRGNNELMELVFENGQIKMQSQSTRTPARIGKYGGVQSILDDISPLGKLDVISEDDDDVVPWLRSYGDALPHDYSSEFLTGPSGVTATQNGLDRPSSGVSDVIVSRDKCAPVDGSDMLNFSHFLRPAALIKAKIPTPASLGANNAVESELIGQCNETLKGTVKSRRSVVQGPEEARIDKLCRELSDNMKEEFRISVNPTKGDSEGQKDGAVAMPASSVCSGNGAKQVISREKTRHSKRKFHDIEESECRSDDIETESTGVTKPAPARGTKRTRAAEVHNLSERRRRDRINEKMRALKELIPNCSKVDKASMLDEAIEYLKTLQLQVQIMTMGSGLCMRPMMFPSEMHPPHYSPMSVGIGMGMGYGMGMPDLSGRNPGCPIFPMQVPGLNGFLRVPPLYGHFNLHNSAPFPGQPPVNSATGLRSCADILKNNNSDSILDAEATQLQDQSGTVQEKVAAATS